MGMRADGGLVPQDPFLRAAEANPLSLLTLNDPEPSCSPSPSSELDLGFGRLRAI